MNTPQKIIWTIYVLIYLYIALFGPEYDKESWFVSYILFGWIPFLILHFMWGNKKIKT